MNNRNGSHEIFQHGDVQLFAEPLPNGLEKRKGNVVMEGELTGHAHRLFDGDFQLYENAKTKERWLKVVTPVNFKHEEHDTRVIPPGEYRIGQVQQWDYDAEESRRVAD